MLNKKTRSGFYVPLWKQGWANLSQTTGLGDSTGKFRNLKSVYWKCVLGAARQKNSTLKVLSKYLR